MKAKILLIAVTLFFFSNLTAQCPGAIAESYKTKLQNAGTNMEAVTAYSHLATYYNYKCKCDNGVTNPVELAKFIKNYANSYSSIVSKYGTMTPVNSCKGLGDGNNVTFNNSSNTQNNYTKLNSTYNTAENLTNAAFGRDSDAAKFVQNLNKANQMYGALENGDYTSAISNATQLLSGLFSRRNTSNANIKKKDYQFQYQNKAFKAYNNKEYNESAEYFKKASHLAKGNDKHILVYFEARSYFKGGSINKANDRIIYLLKNSPKLTVNIYIYGNRIAKERLKTSDTKAEIYSLIERIYKQRLLYFPNKNPLKAHNDYAQIISQNKLASKDVIFNLLEKIYTLDVKKMSPRNIYLYFKMAANTYNTQNLIEVYNHLTIILEEKINNYNKNIKTLKEKKDNNNGILSLEDQQKSKYSITASKAYGQVKTNLISQLNLTCTHIVSLLKSEIDSKRTDVKWLKNSASIMYNTDCQSDSFYETLIRTYAKEASTSETYIYLASIMVEKGKLNEAKKMRLIAFDLEKDPLKKAKYKLQLAQTAKKTGETLNALNLAKEAISFNPTYGKAYLLIGSLYASAANSCGNTEFQKRMVFVAALNKIKKGADLDPSISSLANRYIKVYQKNVPTKELVKNEGYHSGDSYQIKCLINETVEIP